MTEDTRAIVAALDRLTLVVTLAFGQAMPDGPVIDREEESAGCQHPEDRRKSFATAVDDDFFCEDCRLMVTRPHAAKEL